MSATIRNLAGAATWLAMVATPLNTRRGAARRVLSSVVVGGLATTTAAAAARRGGWARSAATAATIAAATTAVERIGTRTGRPFGGYAYTGALRPQVAGVPAIVPLAWFAMAVPARETVHAALGERSRPATRVVGGAIALTAWDLFLDPQMVGEGYWRWARRGRYRGIPLSNYAGWLATGAVVMAVLEITLPVRSDGADRHPDARTTDRSVGSEASADLVAVYATMAVMETLGFAAFFRDRLVAVVGGAAMLPVAAAGVAGLRGGRR